jgi:fibronectin type 3 domain-containing protein
LSGASDAGDRGIGRTIGLGQAICEVLETRFLLSTVTGVESAPAASTNLTTVGTSDWYHWGDLGATQTQHKASGSNSVSYNLIGTGAFASTYSDNANTFSWTDGSPSTTVSNDANGVYSRGVGRGFQIVLPADTTQRTVELSVGVFGATGNLTAALNDGSSLSYTDSSLVANTNVTINGVYQITYAANASDKTLTLTWTETADHIGYANVTMQALAIVTTPLAPTGLVTAAGNAQVALSWDAAANATSYTVERSTTSGTETPIATNVTGTSYTDTTAANNTQYYYVVTSNNTFGQSGASNEGSAIPYAPIAPAPPTGLAAVPGSARVALSWNVTAGANSYTVKRGTSSGSEIAIAAGITNQSFVDTSVTNGTQYYYVVTASNSYGASPASNEASTTPAAGTLAASEAAPAANTDLTALGTGDWYHWGDGSATDPQHKAGVANPIDYTYIGTSPFLSYFGDSPNTFSWTDGTPTAATSYDANGIYSGGVGQGFQLVLPADTDARTVELFVGVFKAAGTLTATLSDGSVATYSDSSLSNPTGTSNGVYTLTYKADSDNQTLTLQWVEKTNFSGGNITLEAMSLTTIPIAPIGLSAMPANSQVALSWSANSLATSYTVLRGTASGGETALATDISGTTYTDSTAANGTTYYYEVVANNAFGQSPASNEISGTPFDPVPPAAPTGLTATAGLTQVSVAWEAATGATTYNIQRGTSSGGEVTVATGITATSYTDTGLTNGTTYYYLVTASNPFGSSGASNEAAAKPAAGVLTGSVATPVSGTTNLTGEGNGDWYHFGDLSGTQAEQKSSGAIPLTLSLVGAAWLGSYNGNPETFSWSDGTPSPSANTDSNGIYTAGVGGGFQIVIPADTQARTLNLYAGVYNSSATLTATLSDGSAVAFTSTALTNASGSTSARYTLTYQALSAGQTLTLKWIQTAVYGYGNVTLQALSITQVPLTPTGLTVTPGDAQASLAWTTDPIATNYTILRGTSSGSEAPIAASVPGGSYTDTTVSDGIQYFYEIEATNSFGTSPASGEVSTTPYAPVPPQAPTGLTATPGSSQMILSWNATPGASSYTIRRSTSSGTETAVATGVPSTTYTDTSLTNGTTYYYVVTANNSYGNGAPSNEASATPAAGVLTGSLPTPQANTNLTNDGTADWYHFGDLGVTLQAQQMSGGTVPITVSLYGIGAWSSTYNNNANTFSWSNGTPDSSALNDTNGVYAGGVGHGFQLVLPATTTQQTLHLYVGAYLAQGTLTASLSDGSAINYSGGVLDGATGTTNGEFSLTYQADSPGQTLTLRWVETVDHTGNGSVTLQALGIESVPAAPTGLAATAGAAQASLTWNASASATSYTLLRATSSGAETTLISGVTTASYIDTALTPGTTYYYEVVAVNPNGPSSASAEAWATPFEANPPATPTGLSATPGLQSVALNWTAVNGASSYIIERSTTTGGETPVASGVTTNSYTDTGLTNGTTYYYQVIASNAYGQSGASVEASATPQAGNLTVTTQPNSSQTDLTALGTGDWYHWGDLGASAPVHKSGVANPINFTLLGTGAYSSAYFDNSDTFNWSDGTPTPSASGDASGVYVPGLGNGFQLVLPADTNQRTANLYVGVYLAQGTLSATLSDGSAVAFTDSSLSSPDGSAAAVYTITYQADSPGQTLTVRWVETTDYSGYGDVTLHALAITQKPLALTGLSATPGNTSVALMWNASSVATGYTILRSTSSGQEVPVGTSATNSFTDTGLTNGATYYYTVVATNSFGQGPASNEATALPWSAIAPAAPAGLTTLPGLNQVLLSWNPVAGATSYTVERATASGQETPVDLGLTGTSVVDRGLPNGVAEFYIVVANNQYGSSPASAEVSSTPNAAELDGSFSAAPATSTNLTTEGTGNWSHFGDLGVNTPEHMAGATTVLNYTAIAGSPYLGTLTDNPDTFSWTDGAPDASVTGDANGIWSSGLNGGFQIVLPADTRTRTVNLYVGVYEAGGTLTASLSDGSAVIFTDASLNSTSNISGEYTLTYRALSANQTLTLTWVQTTSSFFLGNVSISAITLEETPLAPTGLTITPSDAQNSLSWNASLGADTYTIKRATTSGAEVTVATGVAGTSYTDTALVNGTNYYYVVTADNAFGVSPPSAEASAAPWPSQPPRQPTAPTALPGSTQVQLSWAPSPGASSYTILRSTVSGAESVLVGGLSSTTFTDTSLTNGTTYYYEIAADNGWGESSPSAEISTTPAQGTLTGALSPPPANTNLTLLGLDGWYQWGLTSATQPIQAAGAAALNYSFVGGASWASTYTDAPTAFTWTDGSPMPTSPLYGSDAGIYTVALGGGFQLVLPADTVARTAYVYVGVFNAVADLTASLSDGSAVTLNATPLSDSNGYVEGVYQITYRAGSPGQSLKLEWIETASYGGNIALRAVALSQTPAAPVASIAAGNAQALLTWTASNQATSYNLQRGISPTSLTTVATGLTGTAYTDTGLTNGTTYYYSVVAVDQYGQTASNQLTVTPLASAADVTTYHNDLSRDGQNLQETVLTPSNVNDATFGEEFSYALDGESYSQPLYAQGVNIPGQGVHNVVYVTTENDSVYAFDADSNSGPNGGLLWKRSFIGGDVLLLSAADWYNNTEFTFAITGTPVIDPATGTMYLVARTKTQNSDGSFNFFQTLYAIDIATGANKIAPVNCQGSVPGTGDGSVNGVLSFDPLADNQRAALTLANGMVYVSWGSAADIGDYHGWIMAYNAATLSQVAVFCDTPDGEEGGIWQSGGGISVDANGNLFLSTGNGDFSGSLSGPNFGNSAIVLAPATAADPLQVLDYFTPENTAEDNALDLDLGSPGVLLLPDTVGSAQHPHLGLVASKDGTIFLLDIDQLGGYVDPSTGLGDNIVQEIPDAFAQGGIYGTPCYYDGKIYISGENFATRKFDILVYSISNGVMSSQPIMSVPSVGAYSGGILSVSANGTDTSSAVLWAVCYNNGLAILKAFDAETMAPLYSSDQIPGRDSLGNGVVFEAATVADGKVFAYGSDRLVVYGNAIVPGTTANLTSLAGNNRVQLNWTAPLGALTYSVLRSTSSGAETVLASGISGTTFTDTTADNGATYYYTVTADNSYGSGPASNEVTATPYPPVAPPAPQGLSVQPSNTAALLSWNLTVGGVSFNILRGTTGGGESVVATGVTGLTYTDTGLTNGTTYYYEVQAVNSFGQSDASAEATVTPVLAQLSVSVSTPPNDVDLTAQGTAAWYHWGDGSATQPIEMAGIAEPINYTPIGNAKYIGLEDGNPNTFSWENGTPTTTMSQDDHDIYTQNSGNGFQLVLPADTRTRTVYLYVGASEAGAQLTATLSDGSAPVYIDSSLSDQDGLTTGVYAITYHADTANQTLTLSWVETADYSFAGNDGETSLQALALVEVSPAPTGLSANSGDGTATLSWNAALDATSYTIKRATTSGAETTVASGITGTSFTDTGLTNGTTYYYVVAADNGFGESVNSAEISATPFPQIAPPAPASLTALASNGKVILNWDFTVGASTYTVYRGATSGAETALALGVTTTAFTDITATNGTAYFYYVTAVNSYGQSGASNEAPATPAAGVLAATVATAPASVNLTTQGTGGWYHWGDLGTLTPEQMAGISDPVNVTPVGAAPALAYYSGQPNSFFWTNGSPDVSKYNDVSGSDSYNLGNGYQLVLPADTQTRVAYLYVGAYLTSGKLTASLSDGSAVNLTNTSVSSPTGMTSVVYAITYKAASAGQSLTLTWTESAYYGNGTVTLEALAIVQAPVAPTGLTATTSDQQAMLSWNPAGNATSYTIKRATASGAETTLASGITGTSFTDTALTDGTTYYYVVAADNSFGQSANSSEISATPFAPVAPPAPANFATVPGNGLVTLSWSPSLGASSYTVMRATVSGAEIPIARGVANAGYIDTTAANGTAYYYVVQAVNTYGTSADSAEMSATPAAGILTATVASAPALVNLTTEGTDGWYHWGDLGTSQPEEMTGISNPINYTDVGTAPFYLGTHSNSPNAFSWSNGTPNSSATSDANGLHQYVAGNGYQLVLPADTTTRVAYLYVGVYHSAGRLTASLSDGSAVNVSDSSVSSPSGFVSVVYTITYRAISPGQTLTLKWIVATDYGNGTVELQALALAAAPAAPTGLSATPGDTTAALTWTASPGATSYNIKRSTASGAEVTIATGVATASYTDTALIDGTTYYYEVTALNGNGESAPSFEIFVTPQAPQPPGAPMSLTANPADGQVTLNWVSVGGTSFNIKRATTSGAEVTIVTGVSTTSYTDTGLTDGTTYYYVVTAVNANGESLASDEASATPAVPAAPTAPTDVMATPAAQQINLSWDAVPGATSYEIERLDGTAMAADFVGVTPLVTGLTTTSYADIGLVNGATFSYVIVATNAYGDSSISAVVTATALGFE